MSVEYNVVANLTLQGDGSATAKLANVARQADRTHSALSTLGTAAASGMASVGSAVERTIDRMASLTAATVKWGAVLAVGGAIAATKVGLVNVNAELEKTQLGFATMFTMFDAAPNFAAGLSMGKELLAGIRQDAASLPGEFLDFASMAQTVTAPMIQLGKSTDDIRRLTSETVVSAAALGVEFQQAGREMAMLLEGHAGGHNILGLRLGITAHTKAGGKDWNQASGADRLAYVESLMAKTGPALEAYKKSWGGLTSTLTDSLKQFAGAATSPLFERIKGTVGTINTWWEQHPRQVDRVATAIGVRLVGAYDFVGRKVTWVVENFGALEQKAHRAADAFVDGWERAWPIIERIGEFIGDKLSHPMETLKELVALRLGASALQFAPGAYRGLSSTNWKGGAGAASAAPIASGAARASLAEAAGFTKFGEHAVSEAGLFAGAGDAAAPTSASLTGLAGSAGAASVALIAIVGAVDVLTMDVTQQSAIVATLGTAGQEMWRELKTNVGSLVAETSETFSNLWVAARPLVDLFGVALIGAVDGVVYMLRFLLLPLRGLAAAVEWVVSKIPGMTEKAKGGSIAGFASEASDKMAAQADYWAHGPKPVKVDNGPSLYDDKGNFLKAPPTTKTTVDARGSKFEIKLDVRNDNPDRIVRRVFDGIGRAAARPISSSYGPPSKGW